MVSDWILKQMKSENKKVQMTLLYKLTMMEIHALLFIVNAIIKDTL